MKYRSNIPRSSLDPDGFCSVSIDAYEVDNYDALRTVLEAVAKPASVARIDATGLRAVYIASLPSTALAEVAALPTVISISALPSTQPSSERQGMLVAAPLFVGGGFVQTASPCPAGCYTTLLSSKSISDFANTRVAILDTGFDNGNATLHPDFTYLGASTVTTALGPLPAQQLNLTTEANVDNRASHGTVVASIITGWPASGLRKDSANFRYGLGLAPTVATAMVKYFAANSGNYTPSNDTDLERLTNALALLAPWGPNIINESFNMPSTVCQYDELARTVDKHTRTAGVLHVVSAGNVAGDEDCPPTTGECDKIRSPGTAKNALTVGAAESFALNWPNSEGCVTNSNPIDDWANTCSSNFLPATQDARNIAAFSARRESSSVLKPEIMAPALRVTGPTSRDTTWEVCTPGAGDFRCNGIFCNKNVATDTVRYGFSAGTSFAAPAAAGTAAVLRKWYWLRPGHPNPSPAMTKAMIVGGAIDMGGARVRKVSSNGYLNDDTPPIVDPTIGYLGLDDRQGYGLLSTARLLDSVANHLFKDQTTTLTTGAATWTTTGTIVAGSGVKTRLALAWTDRHSPSLGATYSTVNDLYVKACAGTSCWYGNIWAPGGINSLLVTPGMSISPDGFSNVSYIVIPANTFTTGQQITITVVAHSLTGDGIDPNGTTLRQDFALFGVNVY